MLRSRIKNQEERDTAEALKRPKEHWTRQTGPLFILFFLRSLQTLLYKNSEGVEHQQLLRFLHLNTL